MATNVQEEREKEKLSTESIEKPLPGSDSSQDVELHVRDKLLRRTETFVVPISLLQEGMKYFQPVLEKALKLRSKGDLSKQQQDRIALKVNCSAEIFRWLVAYLKKENPKVTHSNAVSLILSSHFLRMDELTDLALIYLRDHLAQIITSGVDMECIPGELLGRFCSITREHHVARALLSLYERGQEEHPGRSFLMIVAHHLAIMRLSGNTVASHRRRWEENVSNVYPSHSSMGEGLPSSSIGSKGEDSYNARIMSRKVCDNGRCEISDVENPLTADNGLRWCRLCGILYDSMSIQRLLKAGKCIEPTCDALVNPLELCMGPRGEIFTSHVASDHPVCITPPSTWDQATIEHWSWQVIGSLLLVVCTVCRSPCSLIEALSHPCPEVKFVSEEPGFGNDEMEVILRWLQLSVEEQVQRGEPNHLIPLRQFSGAFQSLFSSTNFERIVLPRYTAKVRVNSCAPMLNMLGGHTVGHGNGEMRAVIDLPWACSWQGQYHRAKEVALGYESGIDVDLLNFLERQMMNQLYQCKAEAAATQPGGRARFSLCVTPQSNQPLSYMPSPSEKVDRFLKTHKRPPKAFSTLPASMPHSSFSSSKDSCVLSSSLLRSKNNTGRGDDSSRDRNASKSLSRGLRRK